jgi:hypothetical protein
VESKSEQVSSSIGTSIQFYRNKYPVLSAMTHDFLAIPFSIVDSESAFSTDGRILADNRSSMTPETLESLVCCKDWLYEYLHIEGT